jgi:hypothetical protein
MMTELPGVDECRDRLHRAGWSMGEIAGVTCWLVSGQNGENLIVAEGQNQAEAWYRATLQAEAVGVLARPKASTGPRPRVKGDRKEKRRR